MANGIYQNINSKEELAEMEDNRGKMNDIKVWFDKLLPFELIAGIYLTFASVLKLSALVPCIISIVMMKKRSVKLCKTAVFFHLIAALIVIITSVIFCVEAFTSETPKTSLISEIIVNSLTSVSAGDTASEAVRRWIR